MPLNPIAPVTDYQSMLNRIFWFTFAAVLGALYLVRSNVPSIDAALDRIDFDLEAGSGNILPIPGGYLFPALAVGLVTRVFRVHGHIAHLLGIRERFEIDVIIAALARESGVAVKPVSDAEWIARRHDIMRQAFYRFANSKSSEIDAHLIHQALDSWSWFWIGLESTLVFVLTGLVLISMNEYTVGGVVIAGALLLAIVGLPLVRYQCKRFAVAQVKAIVSDPARAAIVRQAFDWLPPACNSLKRSA